MKIWYFGKVYDLDQMTDVDIEKDIEARIEEFTGKVIGVSVKPTDDGYEVIVHRSLNVRRSVANKSSHISEGILLTKTQRTHGHLLRGFSRWH